MKGFHVVKPRGHRKRNERYFRIRMKRLFDALHLGGHIRTDITTSGKDEIRYIDFSLKGFTIKKGTILIIKSKGLNVVRNFRICLRLVYKVGCKIRSIIIGDFRNWCL